MTDTTDPSPADALTEQAAEARAKRAESHVPINPGYAPLRLIAGESSVEAEQLRADVIAYLKPKNVIEKILASDFVHNELELRRIRRVAADAISAARPWSVSRLKGFLDERFIDSPLPTGRYPGAIQDLANKGYSLSDIDAYSALTFASAFDSFDKRAATLELRRNQALAAFEDRRAQKDLADRTIDVDANDAPALDYQPDV